jgi:hypothetical protein
VRQIGFLLLAVICHKEGVSGALSFSRYDFPLALLRPVPRTLAPNFNT